MARCSSTNSILGSAATTATLASNDVLSDTDRHFETPAGANMKYKLRNLSISLVPIPEDQVWIEVPTKDGRGPFVWVHIDGREKGRGRPPGKLVAGGRRISLKKKPGRFDWSKQGLEWNKRGNLWLWHNGDPDWRSCTIIK